MRVVFDALGKEQVLGNLLGKGGEGEVFALQSRPEVAVKLYHQELLQRRKGELREKIEAQIELYPALKHLPLAWPRISVFDSAGQWIGYAMGRAKGVPLRKMAHPALQKQVFPKLGRCEIATRLIRLLEVVQTLHRHGVMLGDVNLGNVLVVPENPAEVWLIDCDSMQVKAANGQHFPCPVGTPEFSAPEHQPGRGGASFVEVIRTPESDTYSLAILMFQCFMLGRHPFDQVDGKSPAHNMLKGDFPYGRNGIRPGTSGSIPAGPWYVIWSWLSFNLKNNFCTTFCEGGADPSLRTPIADWIKCLKQYQYAINNPEYGGLVDELRPSFAKPSKGVDGISVPAVSVSRSRFSL